MRMFSFILGSKHGSKSHFAKDLEFSVQVLYLHTGIDTSLYTHFQNTLVEYVLGI